MASNASRSDDVSAEAKAVSKAIGRAADWLGISNAELAAVIGKSSPTITRLKRGQYTLNPQTKTYELAIQFLRVYRSLFAFAGGDQNWAQDWLRQPNIGLAGLAPEDYARSSEDLTSMGRVPISEMKDIEGLLNVADYLDARRAHS